MTVTLPPDSKAELVVAIREFIDTPSRRRTVHEWKQLAGWMNWALNVFPLLKPGLNEAVKADLEWFLGHVAASSDYPL